MNVRQQLYKKHRLSGLSAYQAARKAGYAHATAIAAYKNIEKRIKFDELLVAHGLDNQSVVKVLGDGLNATRSVIVKELVADDDGCPQSVTRIVEVPDHSVRHKFLETFLKLRGDLKDIAPHNSVHIINMPTILVGGKELEYNIGSADAAEDTEHTGKVLPAPSRV